MTTPAPADDLPPVDALAGQPVEGVEAVESAEALPYRPLGAAAGPVEAAPALVRRVTPIPDAYLARGLAFAASFGLPRQMEAQQSIFAAVLPGIEQGQLGETLAEMGIGLPAGVEEAPAWLRATLVLGAAGLVAVQARRAWTDDDTPEQRPSGTAEAETRDPTRESADAQDPFHSPDL